MFCCHQHHVAVADACINGITCMTTYRLHLRVCARAVQALAFTPLNHHQCGQNLCEVHIVSHLRHFGNCVPGALPWPFILTCVPVSLNMCIACCKRSGSSRLSAAGCPIYLCVVCVVRGCATFSASGCTFSISYVIMHTHHVHCCTHPTSLCMGLGGIRINPWQAACATPDIGLQHMRCRV